MNRMLTISLIVSGFLSCNIGPAVPEADAPKYLRAHGYNKEVVRKLVRMEDVGAELLEKLSVEKSADVRFLVAQNPHLPRRLHDRLLNDADDLVRGGAARSPRHSEEQARQIAAHETHTVKSHLAKNPNVSKGILIDLHEKHGIELMWFAQNPSCPVELVQKMREINDEDALYWLEVTRQRENYKKQRQRVDGEVDNAE